MQKLLFFFLVLLFLFFYSTATAQEKAIEVIPNQPSPEAYDLLKDSKGYLWVAHDFGVSRYDGSSFITLRHPQQNSISISGLTEDKKGRIWCHNFSGQIFYIENLQLHLLSEYNYQQEPSYPSMVVCGNELVATSAKGLFVYNLLTQKSTYHAIHNGTATLTMIGKKVVSHGPSGWHCYEAGKPLSKLSIDLPTDGKQVNRLQNTSYRDTFYFVQNPIGTYCKLTLEGNNIKVHAKQKTGAFINTISVDGGKVWVNTKEHSFTTDGKESVDGLSLSDVIIDNQGNRWMSSLKKGLCVQYNAQQVKRLDDSLFHAGQDIRRMYLKEEKMFLGTANGKLYQLDAPSSLRYLLSVPKGAGAIEQIVASPQGYLLLAASLGLYSCNPETKELKQLPVGSTVKDVAFYKGSTYVATAVGVRVYSAAELNTPQTFHASKEELAGKKTRCRSIAFFNDSLIAAYSDGVYIVRNNTLQPLLYKQNPIYATTVRSVDGKLLIATFSQGLLIFENGKFKSITENEGLASNFVRDIKRLAGRTWLIFTDRFQQLRQDLTGIKDYSFPISKGGMNDFSLLDNRFYVTTSDGVFSMQTQGSESRIQTATYIDKITVNGQDLITGPQLKHDQNYLQFHVSTPFFSPYEKVTYQYRIKKKRNRAWQYGTPGQSVFNLFALEPGSYHFEIVATDENKNIISKPAVYRFRIMPQWYKHWAFRAAAILLVAALGVYLIRLYYRNRLRKQRLAYERQLAVQAERQRISAEIHDDIGAGLSAIRLLTEMSKNKLPESEAKQEMKKVHASVSELSYKMREVIWSLNADNDQLENLLHYIRRQAFALLENSSINLNVFFSPNEIPSIVIKGEKRRHIYLSVKEALHNCLKHSQAKNCWLSMNTEGGTLKITVADDGKGFIPSESVQTGQGLLGMKKRMQQVDGFFKVQLQQGTKVQFIIPLSERT